MGDAAPPHFDFEPSATPIAANERDAMLVDPGFGRVFTDHMAVVRYSDDKGWHDAKVTARAPVSMDPASSVLHYAQEIFEGMKAYRLPDDGVQLFRAGANAARFRHSARRLAMPEIPEDLFLESCRALVRADRDWIPTGPDGALYLRPFMFATGVFLGVKPSPEYLYMVIASSVGPYFKGGAKPISLWATPTYSRAGPGGTGDAKCGGNYASSLVALAEASNQGCDQVLFLDTKERRWIEELGGMNVFLIFDDGSIVTPPLEGTILAGITRDSLIQIARAQGLTVREEHYGIDQWETDAKSGRLREAFACGTAAVVTPIGRVKTPSAEFTIGNGGTGLATESLRDALVAIQRGTAPDRFGWTERLF
jgi:branched-chain amino acid aminotransferase